MVKARKISRDQQYAAPYLGSQLEEDRQRYFSGSAKADIDIFSSDKSLPRETNAQNIERLLSSFELTECLQLGPKHHLLVVIARSTFHEAIPQARSTSEAVLDRDPSRWPRVSFPVQFRIQYFRGKRCIEAAK